eukprot:TRINITY_DN4366_c0_g1_i2.p1 TRINITY_DN4366_c0_g1~~TRINITY_DN4366_c0_g1_i2.p1  ORF type:complete len:298 (-),score=34.81 TRINITY_DN4366_c0_g1_i2:739-1503(-)
MELELKDAQLQIQQSSAAPESARQSETISPLPLIFASGHFIECFVAQREVMEAMPLHTPRNAVWEGEIPTGTSDEEADEGPLTCEDKEFRPVRPKTLLRIQSCTSGDDQQSEATHDRLSTAGSFSSTSLESPTAHSTSSTPSHARRRPFQRVLSQGSPTPRSKRPAPFASAVKATTPGSRKSPGFERRVTDGSPTLRRSVTTSAVPVTQTARGAKSPSAVGPRSPHSRCSQIPSTSRASLIPSLIRPTSMSSLR